MLLTCCYVNEFYSIAITVELSLSSAYGWLEIVIL